MLFLVHIHTHKHTYILSGERKPTVVEQKLSRVCVHRFRETWRKFMYIHIYIRYIPMYICMNNVHMHCLVPIFNSENGIGADIYNLLFILFVHWTFGQYTKINHTNKSHIRPLWRLANRTYMIDITEHLTCQKIIRDTSNLTSTSKCFVAPPQFKEFLTQY